MLTPNLYWQPALNISIFLRTDVVLEICPTPASNILGQQKATLVFFLFTLIFWETDCKPEKLNRNNL